MCGIAGIVSFDVPGEALAPRMLIMRDLLRHRGPDGEGEFIGTHAALGHTRLALIDPIRGAQPMTSRDGRFTVVHNGEIYNFRELQQELAGDWCFQTRSDTEVVLAAYAVWGEQCVERLNGMFAFFVWDEQLQSGFAARDLLGIKPLAYAREGPATVFASEAKAIVGSRDHPPTACIESVLEYLAAPFFSGVERPMFDGVEYLQPGHALRVSESGVETFCWGDFDLLGPLNGNAELLGPEIARRLALSVERCLIADVPVGAFLSGGLDSTLITALASLAGARLDTFTIRFADQEHYDYKRSSIVKSDDTPFADEAARLFGATHTVVPVDRTRLTEDIAAIARINDALPAWEQELAQHHLSRAAGGVLKAVLVGDAADETHYGYGFLLDEEATRSPGAIVSRFGGAPIRRDLVADPIAYFDDKYRRLTESAGHGWTTPLDRTLATTRLIVKRWLPRLLHNGDIHSMAFSLEARVPFGDTQLLDLARSVDPRAALRDGVEKGLLREAARGIIPDDIRTRPKSALPKDQGVAEIYRGEARRAIEADRDFLAALLEIDDIAGLCRDECPLGEWQRALLFRIIAISHWHTHYGVQLP